MIFILTVLALVCFLLAAFGVSLPRINLIALGLALLTLTLVVGDAYPRL